MKIAVLLALAAITPLVSAQAVNSEENYGSLIPTRGYVNPFTNRTATRVGDLVTIIINETASASLNASTNATRKESTSTGPQSLGFLESMLDKFRLPQLKQILGENSTNADSTTSGSGTTTAGNRFSARLTVMVKEVLPNGNLILEGQRWMKINKEDHNLVFSGIVRRDDVRRDNTVLSESVANPRIDIVGKGQVAERQRKGLITRILDWLF